MTENGDPEWLLNVKNQPIKVLVPKSYHKKPSLWKRIYYRLRYRKGLYITMNDLKVDNFKVDGKLRDLK